jgi:hypothetical protein
MQIVGIPAIALEAISSPIQYVGDRHCHAGKNHGPYLLKTFPSQIFNYEYLH